MYQKTIEELYKQVVLLNETPHRALNNTTLRVSDKDYSYYFEAMSMAHEDAVNYDLHKKDEMKLFISYLVELYEEYFADDQMDMDKWEDDMYGYYNLQDGSEYREDRICLSRIRNMTDWNNITGNI